MLMGSIMMRRAEIFFGDKFDAVFSWYLDNGVVYSDSTLFVMACKHNKDMLLNKNIEKVLDKVDSWYVQYVAGDIKRLFEIMPEEMEWAIFERHEDEPPRCYNLSRIRKKLGA
jgi:hypothetical protein